MSEELTYAGLRLAMIQVRHDIADHDGELNAISERLQVEDLDYGELRSVTVQLADAQRATSRDLAEVVSVVEHLCWLVRSWPWSDEWEARRDAAELSDD